MNRGRNTLILLVVAAALGAYIYFVEMKREPASEIEKKPKVFTTQQDKIQELRVASSKGDKTLLKKDGTSWKIVEPGAADADQTEVSSLLSSLTGLEEQRVVEASASDLKPYGLDPARIEIEFKAEGAADSTRLAFGSKTPTGSDLYAKIGSDPKVFLVSGYLETSFDKGSFDLRDKSVLKFERVNVNGLDIALAGQPAISMAKADGAWTIKKPFASRGDYGSIENVLGRLVSGQMKAIVTDTAPDLKPYGLDAPAATLTVSAGSSQAVLLLGGSAETSTFYAKDGSRPLVFTIDQTLADDLKKGLDTYRPKDLVEFRTFSGDRVEATRAGSKVVFEKAKGSGENAVEKWAQIEPKLDVPEDKILDFLSKVSNLRADSFADALPSGAQEALALSLRFGTDTKKTESVTLYRAGEDAYALRPGDFGAAKLPAMTIADALKALDDVKPAPPPADEKKPDEKK